MPVCRCFRICIHYVVVSVFVSMFVFVFAFVSVFEFVFVFVFVSVFMFSFVSVFVFSFVFVIVFVLVFLFVFVFLCVLDTVYRVCSCVRFFMAFCLQMQVAGTRMGFFRCYEAPPTKPYHAIPYQSIPYKPYQRGAAAATCNSYTPPTCSTTYIGECNTQYTLGLFKRITNNSNQEEI